jgi:ribosome maturation factor RimP
MAEVERGERPESAVRRLAERVAEELRLEVVDVRLRRAKRRCHVRIDIDRAGMPGVGLDDCQRLSRGLDPLIEEQGAIAGSFVLEVSSPGLDRPIRSADDIRRNTGRRIVVLWRDEAGGERRSRGELTGGDAEGLTVRTDDGTDERIAFADVVKAHQDMDF